MAAGEGRRLRPLTERWPKPVLPIDGRPVVATLLRELRVAGVVRVFVVTGHLAEQVERLVGDGSAFGLELRTVRQPSVLGSADAVQRAVDAGAATPILVSAADTVFRRGDVSRFAEAFGSSGVAGAMAMRRDPPPSPAARDCRSKMVRSSRSAARVNGRRRRCGRSARRWPRVSASTASRGSSRTPSERRSRPERGLPRSRSGRRAI